MYSRPKARGRSEIFTKVAPAEGLDHLRQRHRRYHVRRVQQDCAWVDAGLGRWRSLSCDGVIGDVRFRTFPWLLVAHPDDNQTEARRRLTEQFATFDAGKAQCFLAKDREQLRAVIEAGFGDFDDFNRVARSLLVGRVSRRDSGSWSSLVAPL